MRRPASCSARRSTRCARASPPTADARRGAVHAPTLPTLASMHRYDAKVDEIAQLCFDYSIARLRMDPVPLDGPRSLADLDDLAGRTITPEGKPAAEVVELWAEVLAPACVSNDSPKFLA